MFKKLLGSIKDAINPPRVLVNQPIYNQPSSYEAGNQNPNEIKLSQPAPSGLPKKFDEYVKVMGTSINPAKKHAKAFALGNNQSLVLEKDPLNEYDKNAIRIIGLWVDHSGSHREQIGWVPKEISMEIARMIPGEPIGATVKSIFLPKDDKNAGFRIDIWCRRGLPTLRD